MKYIAEIKFTGEKNCWECIIDRNNCRGKCWLKPIPDSITDTEQPTNTLTTEEKLEAFKRLCDLFDNGKGKSSLGRKILEEIRGVDFGEPEPTNADIMTAIKAVHDDIRRIQEGERNPDNDANLPTLEDVMKLDLNLSGGLSLEEWLDKKHGYPDKIARLEAENKELKEQLRLIREGERRP